MAHAEDEELPEAEGIPGFHARKGRSICAARMQNMTSHDTAQRSHHDIS